MTDPPAGELGALLEECFGSARIVGIAERLEIGHDPDRFADLPDTLLLMLFASRAGSSYAGGLLANTRYFRRVLEAFNPGRLVKTRRDWRLADEGKAAQFLVERWSTEFGFAAKCGAPGLIGAYLTGFLEAAWDRLALIMVRRRDVVAQAVSLYRAELSGRYHSPEPVGREVSESDYCREEIARRIGIIQDAYAMLESFAERSGKPVSTFWYEDICERPREFVSEVCERARIEAPAGFSTEVRLVPLRDEINETWIERYRAGK